MTFVLNARYSSKSVNSPPTIGPLLPELDKFLGAKTINRFAWLPIDVYDDLTTFMTKVTDDLVHTLIDNRVSVTPFSKWRVKTAISGGPLDRSQADAVKRTWANEGADLDMETTKLDVFARSMGETKYRKEQLIGFVLYSHK